MSLVFFFFVNGEFIMYQNVNRKRGFVINRILPFTMISLVSSEIIENFNLFFFIIIEVKA